MTHPILLVTGGSRGIGAATAILGAARGYQVVITYLANKAAAETVVQTIQDAGGKALAVQADVGVEADVLRLAVQLAQAGVDEIGLSDTTGMGNPAQVQRLFKRMFQEIGPLTGSAHLHNTRGLGLANCLAAYDVGVRTFDSSLGGLGGCPHAPGASGNVVTEDLVFMFEAMGVSTGVDLGQLMLARDALRAGLPDEPLYGMTPEAGLPRGWQPQARP